MATEDATTVTASTTTISSSPLAHPLKGMKNPKDDPDFDREDALQKCRTYLIQHLAPKVCMRRNGKPTLCNCLGFMMNEESSDEVDGVAEYMIEWAGFEKEMKRHLICERVEFAKALYPNRLGYTLPISYGRRNNNFSNNNAKSEEQKPRMICKYGIQAILYFGHVAWKAAVADPGKQHGNIGRSPPPKFIEIYASLHDYFHSLMQQHETRKVPSRRRNNNNNDFVYVLPSNISKHKCYEDWCWECGWKVVKKSNPHQDKYYASITDYERRPHDDDSDNPLWPTGTEPKPVMSWKPFNQFWNSNYPNIKACFSHKKIK